MVNYETDRDALAAVIDNPNMTPELFERLATHLDPAVLRLVAASPNCSTEVLEQVALIEMMSHGNSKDVISKIAANLNTTETTLSRLAQASTSTIRAAVAANAKTPLSVLDELAQDERPEVRQAVAKNPNISEALKVQLREFLPQSSAPGTGSSTLQGLPRIYNPQTDDLANVLTDYAQSENAFVRFVALFHPLTPVKVLQQGARSRFWLERCAVAENAATPAAIRQPLAQDSNRIVRAAAAAHLST